MLLKSLAFLALAATVVASADDFKLDPAPEKIQGVVVEPPRIRFPGFGDEERANDLEALINLQTPVKSQGSRGTCSIFSATAELESLLKIRDGKSFDFSENYLEFLVQAKVKGFPSGGSNTQWNIPGLKRYGTVMETEFPYETYDWLEDSIPASEKRRAEATCGHLKSTNKTICLMGHLDPTNDIYADSALQVREELNLNTLEYRNVYNQREIKKLLNANKPLLLSVRFFYKAWNHRKVVEYGLGERDMEAWGRGEVSTPTEKDIEVSQQHPAGHSIVVVGYDDAKQVYYFKNSWGTGNFGVNSDFLGNGTTDGYGSITYDYAHTYGNFNTVTIE